MREQLGAQRRIQLVVWDPRPLLKLPYFFRLTVHAGVDTVWICGFPFRQMNKEQKQSILKQASDAGLPTIGFIDGDYDWPQQRKFVEYHYKDLTSQLTKLELGNLHVAFAVNVEVYAIPAAKRVAGKSWNGDLSSYIDLLRDLVLPQLEVFARKKVRPDGESVVRMPLLIRFEPWWYRNGRPTEDGVPMYGLRPLNNTGLAAMTYRNTPDEIYTFSEIVRRRSMLERVPFYLGVETIPSAISKTPSFAGREILIGEALSETCRRFSGEEMESFGGFFIHTKDPYEAYRILSILVHGKKETPPVHRGRPPRIITN